MIDLTDKAATLLSIIRGASSRKISNAEEVARRATETSEAMNKLTKNFNLILGHYRRSVMNSKKRQDKLSLATSSMTALADEVQQATVNSLIVNFDRSWWSMREQMDAYLDAADSQAAALGNAMALLDDYTSKCTTDMPHLKRAYAQVERADVMANTRLHDTWYHMVQEIGLLAAIIVDTRAFFNLGLLDATAGNLEANRSVICGGDSKAEKAALEIVDKSLEGGLAYQTWTQFQMILPEMRVLKGRFLAEGMDAPSDETWMKEADRVVTAFQEFVDHRGEIAGEMAARVCKEKQSLLQTEALMDRVVQKTMLENQKTMQNTMEVIGITGGVCTAALIVGLLVCLFKERSKSMA